MEPTQHNTVQRPETVQINTARSFVTEIDNVKHGFIARNFSHDLDELFRHLPYVLAHDPARTCRKIADVKPGITRTWLCIIEKIVRGKL